MNLIADFGSERPAARQQTIWPTTWRLGEREDLLHTISIPMKLSSPGTMPNDVCLIASPLHFLLPLIISDRLPANVEHELLSIEEDVICTPVDEIEFSLPQLRVMKS